MRIAALAAAAVLAVAAWPQQPGVSPSGDHLQHRILNILSDGPVPSLVARLSRDGMDGYNLFLETQSFRFTPENAGSTPVPNQGHAHLYLNGEKVARLYSAWRHLPRALFRDGVNRLQVELTANDHSTWGAAGEPIGVDVLVDTADEDGDPIVRAEVRYTLDWSWGAARRHPEGGWTVVNDRGYSIHVMAGKLTTRSLELLPCHVMPPATPAATLRFWLSPPAVHAGHGSLLPNASKITASHEEDLANPAAVVLESRIVTDPEYCQAHYLVARATGSEPGALSLEISGSWSRGAGGPPTKFRLASASPYGELKDLLAADTGAPVRRTIVGGIDVRVVRSLESLFRGVDFASADAAAASARIVRSVVSDSTILADAL